MFQQVDALKLAPYLLRLAEKGPEQESVFRRFQPDHVFHDLFVVKVYSCLAHRGFSFVVRILSDSMQIIARWIAARQAPVGPKLQALPRQSALSVVVLDLVWYQRVGTLQPVRGHQCHVAQDLARGPIGDDVSLVQ